MTEHIEFFRRNLPLVYTHLAQQLGIKGDGSLLLIFYLLAFEREQGSVALLLSEKSLQNIFEKLNLPPIPLNMLRQALLESDLVQITNSPYANPLSPMVLLNYGGENYLYFHREFIAAQRVGLALRKLKQKMATKPLAVCKQKLDDMLSSHIHGLQLAAEQKLALCHAMAYPFTIISGGPGTGKTTIIRYILNYFLKYADVGEKISPNEVKVAAPTGRAAQRISESLLGFASDVECQTLHRLLGYSNGHFLYHARNPLPLKLLLVDEASMIDVYLLDALLSALSDNCRLVFLGDRNQLPPVGSGAMLAELAPDILECCYSTKETQSYVELFPELKLPLGKKEVSRVVFLMQNLRENQENRDLRFSISRLSHYVLRQDEEMLHEFVKEGIVHKMDEQDGGCHFLKETTPDVLAYVSDFIAPIFEQAKNLEQRQSDLFASIKELVSMRRVLSFTREFQEGTQYLNAALDKIFGADEDFYHGRQVLITRNDPRTGLHNGDIGVVLKLEEKKVFFIKNNALLEINPMALPPHESAWAITIHKAQGSEYEEILILLPRHPEHRLNTREMLYTAITRAKKKVYFLGNPQSFLEGAKRRLERENGYPFWEMSESSKFSVS